MVQTQALRCCENIGTNGNHPVCYFEFARFYKLRLQPHSRSSVIYKPGTDPYRFRVKDIYPGSFGIFSSFSTAAAKSFPSYEGITTGITRLKSNRSTTAVQTVQPSDNLHLPFAATPWKKQKNSHHAIKQSSRPENPNLYAKDGIFSERTSHPAALTCLSKMPAFVLVFPPALPDATASPAQQTWVHTG